MSVGETGPPAELEGLDIRAVWVTRGAAEHPASAGGVNSG